MRKSISDKSPNKDLRNRSWSEIPREMYLIV
jgi:hypothetical protein